MTAQTHTQVAGQVSSTSSSSKRVPGEEGVWLFIIGDMVMFALLFGVFMYYRALSPELFASSQLNLRQDLALANTLLLLCSSWFVAIGMNALRGGRTRRANWCFPAAGLCGLAFVFIKYVEYSEKFSGGITINSNEFYTYYFVLTGIHLIHLIVGLGVLVFVSLIARKGKTTGDDLRNAESGSLYWHMVDLLWIVLLAIVYLV